MQYVPYHKLGDTPNIIVDGRGNDHSLLTLSHWPGTVVADDLRADVSAQIVFNYLANPAYHVAAEAVSNNHFDEDGLVSMWALLNPEEALERKQQLIEIALAGDFGTYTDREIARISFVLSAWTKADLSPLNHTIFRKSYPEQTMVLYEELLPRLAKIMDRVHYLEQYWIAEDRLLDQSEADLAAGATTIEEFPELDLAVVRLPEPEPHQTERLLSSPWEKIVQSMAIHNSTQMMRILMMKTNRYRFYYRYETWVQYVSRPLQPRIDLTDLARTFNQLEQAGAVWSFDGIGDIVPTLEPGDHAASSISQGELKESIVSYLVSRLPEGS